MSEFSLSIFSYDLWFYSFSTALFPTTPSTEFQTLSSGGLPPSSYSNGLPPPLRQLLNETFDFLDCTDCSTVRKICLDKLFEKFGEGCESSFKSVNGGEEAGGRFEDVTERSVRLAGLLPNVARLSHLILNGIPNEFVEVSHIILCHAQRTLANDSCRCWKKLENWMNSLL